MPQYDTPPLERTIIPPVDGWKAHSNPVHDYVFFTGFLNAKESTPGAYNHFEYTDEYLEFHHAHYLKAKEELATKTLEGIIKA